MSRWKRLILIPTQLNDLSDTPLWLNIEIFLDFYFWISKGKQLGSKLLLNINGDLFVVNMNLSGYQGIYRYIYVYKLKYLNIDQNICGITTMPAVQTNANWTKWPVCCFTLTIESNNYAGNYPFPAFCLASVTKHIIVKIFGYGLRFKNLFQNNCLNIQQMLPTAT